MTIEKSGVITGQSGTITGHPDKEETEGQRLLERVSLETSASIARRMNYSAIHRLSNRDTMEILPRRNGSTLATILEEWEIATAQRLRSAVRKLDPEQRRQVREEMREMGNINKQLTERALLIATGATDPGPKGYYDTIQLHGDPPGGDGGSKPAGVAQDTSQAGGREEDAAMKERETVLEEICREVVRDIARRMKLRSIYELRDARQHRGAVLPGRESPCLHENQPRRHGPSRPGKKDQGDRGLGDLRARPGRIHGRVEKSHRPEAQDRDEKTTLRDRERRSGSSSGNVMGRAEDARYPASPWRTTSP